MLMCTGPPQKASRTAPPVLAWKDCEQPVMVAAWMHTRWLGIWGCMEGSQLIRAWLSRIGALRGLSNFEMHI